MPTDTIVAMLEARLAYLKALAAERRKAYVSDKSEWRRVEWNISLAQADEVESALQMIGQCSHLSTPEVLQTNYCR
jgi:hypothetical protein